MSKYIPAIIVIILFVLFVKHTIDESNPATTVLSAPSLSINNRNNYIENIANKKILNVPYLSQVWDNNGKELPRWQSTCGAVSTVSVLSYYNIIKEQDPNKLYNYIMDNQTGIPEKERCGIKGVYAYTLYTCENMANERSNIVNLFNLVGLQSELKSFDFNEIKNQIDGGNPVIMSFHNDFLDHIVTVVGYYADGRLIVNDSYTNAAYNTSPTPSVVAKHAEYAVSGTTIFPGTRYEGRILYMITVHK